MRINLMLLVMTAAVAMPIAAAQSHDADTVDTTAPARGLQLQLSTTLTLDPSGTVPAPLDPPAIAATRGESGIGWRWPLALFAGLAAGAAIATRRRSSSGAAQQPAVTAAPPPPLVNPPLPERASPDPAWRNTVATLEHDVRTLRRALDTSRDAAAEQETHLCTSEQLVADGRAALARANAANDALLARLEKAQAELAHSEARHERSQHHAAAAHERSLFARRTLANADARYAELARDHDAATSRFVIAERRTAALAQALAAADRDRVRLNTLLDDAHTQHIRTQRHAAAAFDSTLALRDRLGEAETQHAEMHNRLAENADAAAELIDEFQAVRARWQEQAAAARDSGQRVTAAESRRDAAETALADMAARLRNTDEALDGARQEAETARADMKTLRSRLEDATVGATVQSEAMAARADDIARLKRVVDERDAGARQLRTANMALTARVAALETELREVRDHRDKLSDERATIDAERQALDRQTDELRRERAALRLELERNAELTARQHVPTSFTAARRNGQPRDDADLERELVIRDQIIDHLRRFLREDDAVEAELSAEEVGHAGDPEFTRRQLVLARREIRNLRSDLRMRADLIKALENDALELERVEALLDEKTSTTAFLQNELTRAVEALALRKNRRRALDQDRDAELVRDLQAARERITAQNHVIAMLEQSANDVPTINSEQARIMQELRDDLSASRTLIRALEKEIQTLKARTDMQQSRAG